MVNDFELMEQLLARFCHDLSGPIGAVNNGVEFLQEEKGDMREQATKLIASSAGEAVARLQFYRQAFGIVPIKGEANLQRIKLLTESLLANTKIKLDWPDEHVTHQGFVGHKFGKLMMNLFIVCFQSLIYGGTMSVSLFRPADSTSAIGTKIHGSADQIKIDPEVAKILQKGHDISVDELNSRNVQPLFLVRLAHYIKADVTCDYHEKSLTLTARLSQ